MMIHHLNGVAVLAHALSERFSIMHNMMTIDQSLDFDGIEVTKKEHQIQLLQMFPFLHNTVWFYNSDAHRLDMINEPLYEIDSDVLYGLWRKRYG